jgi:hypothetical protein
MSFPEKCLKFILRLDGLLAIMAVVAVFMPHSWLAWCVSKVEPDLSVGFLVAYLARSLSMFFVLVGIFLLIFASDVRRYRRAITCVAIWVICAVCSFALYSWSSLPALAGQWFFWFVVGDASLSLLFALAILACQFRMKHGKNMARA